MDADLVAHGRVLRVEMRGRATGEWRTATVGFVDGGDGSYLVAANTGSKWGENLLADPTCRVTVGDRTFDAVATTLDVDQLREGVCRRPGDRHVLLMSDRHQPRSSRTGTRRNVGPRPWPSDGVP